MHPSLSSAHFWFNPISLRQDFPTEKNVEKDVKHQLEQTIN